MDYQAMLVIFSLIGIIENVIAFKRGKALGCLGLVAGAIGFLSTAFGSWPVGLMILIGLGLMAFLPGKPKELTDSGREAELQADPFIRTASAPAVQPGSNPLANLEVSDFMEGDFDAEVNQIEEDLIQGRIDRATYLERRRALLN